MSARVCVVIPTKNAGAVFRETLEMVFAQDFPEPFEVVVIDSGSQDGTLALCRQYPVRLLEIPPASFNHGATRNQAIASTESEFVALTVQDATPASRGWLAALLQPMRDDPQVAAVYGRQRPRPGASYLAQQGTRLWYAGWQTRAVQQLADPAEWESLTIEQRRSLTRFDNVTSCVRRAVWEQIPFPAYSYAEDVAWALQVLKAGYAIVYEPAAIVVHSHDRDLAYSFRRAYAEARSLARILNGSRGLLDAHQAQLTLEWLGDEAATYLRSAASEAGAEPQGETDAATGLGELLAEADRHWQEAARIVEQDGRLDEGPVAFFLGNQDKALFQPLFDNLTVGCLFGPDPAFSPEERDWLFGRLCWWSEEEDEEEARAWYRALFDAESMGFLLGPASIKSAEDQKWVAWGLDRAERSRSRFGLRLGRPISRRLQGPRGGAEDDVAFAFEVLWRDLSSNVVKEAVTARLQARIQSGRLDARDLAAIYDRLWGEQTRSYVKEAIYRSLMRRIEAAAAGERPLSEAELAFVSDNLWARLKDAYLGGTLAGLLADRRTLPLVVQARRSQRRTVGLLCAAALAEQALTGKRFWRARLYAATMVVGGLLGQAAAAQRPHESGGPAPTSRSASQLDSGGPSTWWRALDPLLGDRDSEDASWSALNRAMATGV